MTRYLVAAIWPAGMAIIFGVGFLAWRRGVVIPDASANRVSAQAGRHHSRRNGTRPAIADAAVGSGRLLFIAAVGAVGAFGAMYLLGLLVVNHGLASDKPVFTSIQGH